MNRLIPRPYWLVSLLILFAAGCASNRMPPRVINHPPPNLKVDTGAFSEAGCPLDDSGRNVCPPESELGVLGCDTIAAPGDYLGGLEPALPINLCWTLGAQGLRLEQNQYLYRDGCLLPQYARYVVRQDGEFILLENLEDLKKTYAPIATQDEALSYAMAATGLSAYFGFEAPRGFRYFVRTLEDSHVDTIAGEYRVYLYDYKLCGCGPHTTEIVELLVKPDGEIQEIGRAPVFEDPEQDTLCVD